MIQENGLTMYWETSIRMGKAGKKLKGNDWEKLEEIGDFDASAYIKNRNGIKERQRN
jgi:hypothetical protein